MKLGNAKLKSSIPEVCRYCTEKIYPLKMSHARLDKFGYFYVCDKEQCRIEYINKNK